MATIIKNRQLSLELNAAGFYHQHHHCRLDHVRYWYCLLLILSPLWHLTQKKNPLQIKYKKKETNNKKIMNKQDDDIYLLMIHDPVKRRDYKDL